MLANAIKPIEISVSFRSRFEVGGGKETFIKGWVWGWGGGVGGGENGVFIDGACTRERWEDVYGVAAFLTAMQCGVGDLRLVHFSSLVAFPLFSHRPSVRERISADENCCNPECQNAGLRRALVGFFFPSLFNF